MADRYIFHLLPASSRINNDKVVIPLLRAYVVDPGWVTPRDFLIGLAITQAFPGPNFNCESYPHLLIFPLSYSSPCYSCCISRRTRYPSTRAIPFNALPNPRSLPRVRRNLHSRSRPSNRIPITLAHSTNETKRHPNLTRCKRRSSRASLQRCLSSLGGRIFARWRGYRGLCRECARQGYRDEFREGTLVGCCCYRCVLVGRMVQCRDLGCYSAWCCDGSWVVGCC